MTTDSEGLHEIANTKNLDRQADIVFVHGLGGASHGTWRHGKEGKQGHFFWPEELGKDLPNCGIWSVGYPAGFTELGKPGMIIEKRAGNVSHKLATAGLGHRPLFFVTHSMGGLIVKSLIVDSQILPDVDRKRIVSMVRGIVFCGTPHRGSDFANMAGVLGKYFGGVVDALFGCLLGSFVGGVIGRLLGTTQAHVNQMRANAEPLDILHDKFIEWHHSHPVPVDSYAENIGLFRKRWFLRPLPLGLVVPRASANPGIVGHTVHDVDDDHLTLVKPPNRQHDVYAGVLCVIHNALAANPPAPDSPEVVTPIAPRGVTVEIPVVREAVSESTQEDYREPVHQSTHAQWFLAHPYPMPPHFTGRDVERRMLSDWLTGGTEQPLLALRALGGFGKSALVWHWLLHGVPQADWPRVLWWSFYERDATFEQFVATALDYLTGGQVNASSLPARQQLAALLQSLQPGTLIVLDGFERALRAFSGLNAAYQGDDPSTPEPTLGQGTHQNERECISPLADSFLRALATLPGIYAKVLLTTRLRPAAVETRDGILLDGCREDELTQLHPADAMAFFHAQGIRGTHTEIETACAPYGYHPLSLRLLAGLIVGDLQQPGDIAAARHLDVSGDLVQRQHHVLEQSYNSLSPARRALLSRIACFRGPVSYDALRAIQEDQTLDADLRDLVARGLLHHDRKENRFDLHPIVRRYAYDRLTAPDRTAAHTRLRDYFAAVPKPKKVASLNDLAPVIELYYHTVRAGQYDGACDLFYERISKATYYQFGAYQLQIDLLRALFPDGEDRSPRLKKESDQAWALNALANSYSLSGQPRRAVPLFEASNDIDKKRGNKKGVAIGLGNLAIQQLVIGALRTAEATLHSIALGRDIQDEINEAVDHQELGRVLAYRGAWTESEAELAKAVEIFAKQKSVQLEGVTWAYRAVRELLRLRPVAGSQSAIPMARRALELAEETARTMHVVERDYVRAHWLLGAAHRFAGQWDEAERYLHEALERCRRIDMADHEADILIDLARLRRATGVSDETARLAEEALVITERSGYVLQGADAHLVLAELALAHGDKAAAREHATEARRLATCDGPPDYTYKAAYDEAGALLSRLGA